MNKLGVKLTNGSETITVTEAKSYDLTPGTWTLSVAKDEYELRAGDEPVTMCLTTFGSITGEGICYGTNNKMTINATAGGYKSIELILKENGMSFCWGNYSKKKPCTAY